MKFPTLKTMLLAGATVLGMAGSASALTFGSIPGAAGVTNDALVPLFGAGTTSLNGWYGAQLYLIAGAPVTITATYLGAEAGNNNSFSFGGTTQSTGGNTNAFNSAGFASWIVNNVNPGLLSFSFSTNGGLSVSNGSNPDNTVPAATPGVNFFTSFVGNQNAGSGQGVYLFFDDDGAANDDNHDDMVVRLDITGGEITVVPLPAGGLLLLTALGGIAVLRRRRKAA